MDRKILSEGATSSSAKASPTNSICLTHTKDGTPNSVCVTYYRSTDHRMSAGLDMSHLPGQPVPVALEGRLAQDEWDELLTALGRLQARLRRHDRCWCGDACAYCCFPYDDCLCFVCSMCVAAWEVPFSSHEMEFEHQWTGWLKERGIGLLGERHEVPHPSCLSGDHTDFDPGCLPHPSVDVTATYTLSVLGDAGASAPAPKQQPSVAALASPAQAVMTAPLAEPVPVAPAAAAGAACAAEADEPSE